MFDLMKQLPDFLQPLAEKARDEQRKANEAKRVALAAERAALAKRVNKALPGLVVAREAADARCAEAKAAIASAYDAVAAADSALRSLSNEMFDGTNRLDIEIRALADPRIDAFAEELEDLLPVARRERPTIEERPQGHTLGGQAIVDVGSNRPAILGRIAAIRAAIEQARALKTTAGVDVEREIERIRATIPTTLPITFVAAGAIKSEGGYRWSNASLPSSADDETPKQGGDGWANVSPRIGIESGSPAERN